MSNDTAVNVKVLCNNCGKIMKLHKFQWINGMVLIDAEPCGCVYNERMKKFNEELEKLI